MATVATVRHLRAPRYHKAIAHQQANFFWSTTPSRTGMKRNVFFMPGIDVYFCSTAGRLISAVGVNITTTSLIVLLRCDCTYSSVLKLAFTCSATCKARSCGGKGGGGEGGGGEGSKGEGENLR